MTEDTDMKLCPKCDHSPLPFIMVFVIALGAELHAAARRPPTTMTEDTDMKLCPKCDHSPLPFIMVFVIAATSAFATWLTLGLSIPETAPRAAAAALVFAAVGATLLHYIFSCLKRHCTHQGGQTGGGRLVPGPRGTGRPVSRSVPHAVMVRSAQRPLP